MKLFSEVLLGGIWFKDHVDPTDKRFRLVSMRIPMDPALAVNGYEHAYVGRMVVQRLRRFAATFLEATQDLTHAHGMRILRSAVTAEEEVPRG